MPSFWFNTGIRFRPKDYCMYTKPVDEIIKGHDIKYDCDADDTQVKL